MLVIKIESTVSEDGNGVKTSFECGKENANLRECLIGNILCDLFNKHGEAIITLAHKMAIKKQADDAKPQETAEESGKTEDAKGTGEKPQDGGANE